MRSVTRKTTPSDSVFKRSTQLYFDVHVETEPFIYPVFALFRCNATRQRFYGIAMGRHRVRLRENATTILYL